jgi:glycosyltransferase involved in cell wall biosynthesis
MLIGIDARELGGRPTGVGRYLANLLTEWACLPEARSHRFLLYGAAGDPDPTPVLRSANGPTFTWQPVPGATGTAWEQVRLPPRLRRDAPEVFFAPGYTAPLAIHAPLVLAVHDLSYLAHPAWFRRREQVRRAWLTRLAARKARIVLTISRFSRDEILRLLHVPLERIRVVPLAIRRTAAARCSGDPGHEPAVLFVGSIFNRRHVPDLIKAFERVAACVPAARLDIVGENRTWPHQDLDALVRQTSVARRVAVRSYVVDDTLVDLYARARVFAFLSEYEGFGLTPLEALGYGVPLVVLDTPVAREVYGDAAVYVPRGDVQAAADALVGMLTDDTARAAVLSHAQATLARYSWERTARATLAALEEAAG